MEIIVLDLDGKEVKSIPTSPKTLGKDIENAKKNYPPGEYHAKLKTY